jgi:uncharacterized SAM-binding protein YcdF (DUF218 family)
MVAGSDFLRYLFSGGGAVCGLLLAALWMAWSRRPRSGQRLLVIAAVIYTFASMYGPQYLIARSMARPFAPFTAADARRGARTAIVVLGSGSVEVEDWDGRTFAFVDRSAAARVLEAARVFRLVDPAIVISSGGDPHDDPNERPTGETMRDALVALGVPAERILIETASHTTRDEALIVGAMLQHQHVDQTILVTSETHMPRALGTFRSAGLDVIPAIAQELERHVPAAEFILPSESGLWIASSTIHEVLGLTYYWMRGWWRPDRVAVRR